MIIDTLSHVGPRKNLDFKPEQWRELMKKNNIDKALVCCQMELTDNKHTYEILKDFPEFYGMGTCNPWNLECYDELDKCFKDYGFKAIKMNCLRYSIAADRYELMREPFEVADKYNAFLVVHCLSDMFSIPSRWEKMAKAFPNVGVILSHIGVPYMSYEAIEAAYNNENVFVNTAACFPPILKKAKQRLGASKIIYASDTPFGSLTQELRAVDYICENDSEKEMILGLNAKMLIDRSNNVK